MAKVYVLKEPTREPEWNYFLLWEAARIKKYYVGTYYVPRLNRLLAVFKPTPGTYVSDLAFEGMDFSIIRDGYKMICIPGCGRCCEANSGAFILGNEVKLIPRKLAKFDQLPSFTLSVYGRKIKVYRLDVGPRGRCIFYDEEAGGCILDRFEKYRKPVICLIHYCTVFAERNGERYIKVSVKYDGKSYVPVYRHVSDDEWEGILRNLHKWKMRRIIGYRKGFERSR